MENDKQLWISVLLSVLFGSAGASIAAVNKKVSIGQSIVAVLSACLFSSTAPFILMALGLHWGWTVPISAFGGVMIFGIIALVGNTEKKIPGIDVTGLLPSCVADKFKQQPKDGETK